MENNNESAVIKREIAKHGFYSVFHNALIRNMCFFVIGIIFVLIGSFNYSSNLVICFCFGMTSLMISVYRLEKDLSLQDAHDAAIKESEALEMVMLEKEKDVISEINNIHNPEELAIAKKLL